MVKVSIIIPVYNAGAYIASTIRSIQVQTYSDWEIIAVDDCSNDNSEEVILSFHDSRIHYFRQKRNGGPALARNTGIDYAQGTYLAFVDSDDTINALFLEKMVSTAEEGMADVVWCNYYEVYDGIPKLQSHGFSGVTPIHQHENLTFFYDAHVGIGSMCNKLYRKSFIEQYRLRINPNRYHGEDWEFNLCVFRNNPKVIAIEDPLYNYIRQNMQSVVSSYHASDFDNLVRTMCMLSTIAEERGIQYDRNGMYSRTVYQIITLLVKLVHSNYTDKKAEMHRIRKDGFVRYLFESNVYDMSCLTLKQKVYFILFRLKQFAVCNLLMSIFR